MLPGMRGSTRMRASPAGPGSLPGLRNHFFNGITGLTSSFRPLPYNFRARVLSLLFTLLADLNGVPVSLFDFEQPPPISDTPPDTPGDGVAPGSRGAGPCHPARIKEYRPGNPTLTV